MKSIGLIVFLLIGAAMRAESAAKINDIVSDCMKAECDTGPHCIGYNILNGDEDDKCAAGISTENCTSSFVSVIKVGENKYQFKLAGKIGKGKVGWVGIFLGTSMVDDEDPAEEALQLGGDFAQDSDHEDWWVCQFELEIAPADYKVGLYLNTNNGKVTSGKIADANIKTSSSDPMDFLTLLMVATPPPPAETGSHKMVGGLALVITSLFV